jgi:hypothetical protein
MRYLLKLLQIFWSEKRELEKKESARARVIRAPDGKRQLTVTADRGLLSHLPLFDRGLTEHRLSVILYLAHSFGF